ncbi:MAG: class II aldolase/adducin family protein [Candidatus Thorarchaeota archaeon]|jgi:hypothetical protein
MSNVMVVAGNPITGKGSKIAGLLYDSLVELMRVGGEHPTGAFFNAIVPKEIKGQDLTVWMPDFPNENRKSYPVKDIGSVLICSKVMREGYNDFDAVSRIFWMGANAVIAIYKDDPKNMTFKLIDALGNVWAETSDIVILVGYILDFFRWVKGSMRRSLSREPLDRVPAGMTFFFLRHRDSVDRLIEINNRLAGKVVSSVGGRFFGNLSTRCVKLFPTSRALEGTFLVSPRNIDKSELLSENMVICSVRFPENIPPSGINGGWNYYGNVKPSVDTPIQLALYEKFPEIMCMIHGHAYLRGAPYTGKYVPCGDMREVIQICRVWDGTPKSLNIKKHGFLIVAGSLDELEEIVSDADIEGLHE